MIEFSVIMKEHKFNYNHVKKTIDDNKTKRVCWNCINESLHIIIMLSLFSPNEKNNHGSLYKFLLK